MPTTIESIRARWPNHTEECYRRQLAQQQDIEAFKERWPAVCETCGGRGGHSTGGWSFENPPEWEDCPDCLCKGKCPRCGGPLPEDAEACSACKWQWPCHDYMQTEYDCDCAYFDLPDVEF